LGTTRRLVLPVGGQIPLNDSALESVSCYDMTSVRIEKEDAMAKGCFMVRADVPDEKDRGPFDHWYAITCLGRSMFSARNAAGATA